VTLVAPGNFIANSHSYRLIPQVIIDKRAGTELVNQDEINADLFFCDMGMNFACFDLAWKLEMPVVGFGSSTLLAVTPSLYKSDPLHGCHVNMENESFYDRFTSRMENILCLFDTFLGLEIPTAMLLLHQEIGPVLPDTYPGLTPALDSFLNSHPRTMYFSLGTVVFTSPQNIAILLKSCLELIDQNVIDGVIWATVRTNVTELITKVFLSHGETSSSHESMYTATPMLILPIMTDQLGNAEKLELT
ncbi:30827_t:CDS:2, partial [Racocetra persica]